MVDINKKITRKDFLKNIGVGVVGIAAISSPIAISSIKKNSNRGKRKHSSGLYGEGIYG